MRNYKLISFVFLALLSCSESQKPKNQIHEMPEVLNDKSVLDISSKRGAYSNLVESLYNDLSSKTPELQKLETQIDLLNDSKSDSLDSFENYNSKNEHYYESANRKLDDIKDSVLRKQIKLLITNSIKKYDSKTKDFSQLINSINKKEISLNDLHTIIKITRTIPIIERYQNQQPSLKPLISISNSLDKSIKLADSLAKY
jgi:hypothetical protein